MASHEVTESNFREIYENNEIVVLDFWASWCAPCHAFAPTFEEVSDVFPEIFFGKVETENQVKLSQYFAIRSIPTIIVIRESLEVFRGSGGIDKNNFAKLVKEISHADMDEIKRKIEEEEA